MAQGKKTETRRLWTRPVLTRLSTTLTAITFFAPFNDGINGFS
jgi:hypothetical protein